jgi:hypothetical protein
MSMQFSSVLSPARSVIRGAPSALGAAMLCALAACTPDPAAQFAPTGSGTISGLVFTDADNNGSFNPVAGDSVLAGVGIQFRNRGTDSAVARVTTDANGRFTLSAPVGTGDLFVESNTTLTTRGLVFCGARVTTYLNEQAFINVPIKGGCVIRIVDSKLKATGTRVTISGIVIAQPGRFRAQGDNLYIQDPSSGMQIFGGAVAGPGIVEGDSIEVTGDYNPFNGEPEVTNPKVALNIRKGVGVPVAKEVTVAGLAAISSGNSADVGRLVVVRKVRIGDLQGTSPAGRNANMTSAAVPTDITQIRFDGNVLTALLPLYSTATQKCYDVTGVLGFFTPGVQLKPRFAQDIVEVPCS